MDIIAFIFGFIIGVVVVALAIELGMKKFSHGQPGSRPTHKWTINELKNPRIIAEYMGDIDIPKGAKVVVNQYKDESKLHGHNVRKHSGIRGNFVLGTDRALIIAGPLQKEELGIWTIEKSTINKLEEYFEDSWDKGAKLTFKEQ